MSIIARGLGSEAGRLLLNGLAPGAPEPGRRGPARFASAAVAVTRPDPGKSSAEES